MTELLFLLGAHYVADYPLQGDYICSQKGNNDYLLVVHSFIYAFVVGLTLIYFDLFAPWKFLFLLGSHFLIDRLKERHGLLTLRGDQGLHGVALLILRFIS